MPKTKQLVRYFNKPDRNIDWSNTYRDVLNGEFISTIEIETRICVDWF